MFLNCFSGQVDAVKSPFSAATVSSREDHSSAPIITKTITLTRRAPMPPVHQLKSDPRLSPSQVLALG